MIDDKNPKELYKSGIYGNLNYDVPGTEYLTFLVKMCSNSKWR